MTTRLHLLCSASTSSVSSIAFPADEPLEARGRDNLAKLAGRLPACEIVLRSPSLSAAQTTEGFALEAQVEPLLRDCDFGRWTGRSFVEVRAEEPEAVADWLQNPNAAPHGGESFADVMARVGGWMDSVLANGGSVLAVTHAPVIRAAIVLALRAGPEAQGHVDVAPLTRVRLSGEGGRWTLAALVPLKDDR